MYLGGSAHCAPLGRGGRLTNGFSGSGTNMVKASRRPSGDQLRSLGACCTLVRRASAPVSMWRNQIWALPSRSLTQARRLPSGDQRGRRSSCLPLVSGTASLLP